MVHIVEFDSPDGFLDAASALVPSFYSQNVAGISACAPLEVARLPLAFYIATAGLLAMYLIFYLIITLFSGKEVSVATFRLYLFFFFFTHHDPSFG